MDKQYNVKLVNMYYNYVIYYTGSLGLNLLDPVSCRGLFALFAPSFDIVSPEASRHRRLTFRFAPGRHARIQQTFIVICGWRGSLDDPTDDRPARVAKFFFPKSSDRVII